jgi:hypothetical protein
MMNRTCPSCAYSLAQLGEVGVCPECGFSYDPRAKVIPLAGKQWYGKQIAAGVALLGLVGFAGSKVGALQNPVWLAFGAFILICVVYYLFRAAHASGRKSRLILNRLGIRFEGPEVDSPWVEWSDIGHARYVWVSGVFRIDDQRGRKILRITVDRLGSARCARRCAKAINHLLPYYAVNSA